MFADSKSVAFPLEDVELGGDTDLAQSEVIADTVLLKLVRKPISN